MEITRVKAKATVANVTMTSANTEYSYELPNGTTEFWVKLRTIGFPLKVAMVSGESGTTYFTVQSGKIHKETDVKSSKVNLYFQSAQANMVAEITSFK